jgi:hypothetical protein
MANALVISGHLRTFRTIADDLVNFIDKNKLDVYMYVWNEGNQSELDFAIEKLKPVKWKSERNEDYAQGFFEAEERISKVNPKQLITPDRNHVTLSMHFARRQAFKLIEKEYDNVVFTRFDTSLFPFDIEDIIQNRPDVVITPTNEQYGMVSDIFAIIPWKYANNYFFFDRAEDILSRRFSDEYKVWLREKFWWENGERDMRLHDENRYCPHQLCMRNYFESNTPYIVMDLPVYIKR